MGTTQRLDWDRPACGGAVRVVLFGYVCDALFEGDLVVLWTEARSFESSRSVLLGVLFGCFAKTKRKPWFTWWFNHLPRPSMFQKRTPTADGRNPAPLGNHGKPWLVGMYKRIIIPGFFGWCRISSILSMTVLPWVRKSNGRRPRPLVDRSAYQGRVLRQLWGREALPAAHL